MIIEDLASQVVRFADWAIVVMGSWLLIATLILIVRIEKQQRRNRRSGAAQHFQGKETHRCWS